MALSGTIYSSSFGSGYFRLRLVWNATQSVSNNTTTINTSLYLDSISSYGAISDGTNNNWDITIDGSKTSGSTQSDVSANGSKKLGSHSRTISHNSDGTKSLTLAASHYIDISWGGSFIGTRSLSDSITLNTIPRASGVSILNGSGEMGKYNDLYIKIARASSSFTHTLKWTFGKKSGTVAEKLTWVDHEWTIPADLATEATNSTSGWGTITCYTYNGSTHIGTTTTRFYATVPNNADYNPTITTPTLAETNSAVTTAVGGYYVQGKSKIKITASGATKYGATIKSINFKIKNSSHTGSLSGSTATATSTPTDSGVHSVVATITDSRGRTNTSDTSFTITAYSPPKITDFRAYRLQKPNTTIQTIGVASMSAIGTANTVTMKISTSPKGANTWTVAKTVTAVSGTSLTTGTHDILDMLITASYDIKIDVWDELTTTASTQTIPVGTAIFPMTWSKTGVGIGKVWERGALDVAGAMNVQGVGAFINMFSEDASGHGYITWNKSDGTRVAYAGISSASSKDLNLYNEQGGGIILKGSMLKFNNDEVVAQGETTQGNWVKLYDGTAMTYQRVMWNPNNGSMYAQIPYSYPDSNFITLVGGWNNDLYSLEEASSLTGGRNNNYQVRIVRNGAKARGDLTWDIGIGVFTIGRWK